MANTMPISDLEHVFSFEEAVHALLVELEPVSSVNLASDSPDWVAGLPKAAGADGPHSWDSVQALVESLYCKIFSDYERVTAYASYQGGGHCMLAAVYKPAGVHTAQQPSDKLLLHGNISLRELVCTGEIDLRRLYEHIASVANGAGKILA